LRWREEIFQSLHFLLEGGSRKRKRKTSIQNRNPQGRKGPDFAGRKSSLFPPEKGEGETNRGERGEEGRRELSEKAAKLKRQSCKVFGIS